jgi:RNA polymerase sigma factor (sigma-70 family)
VSQVSQGASRNARQEVTKAARKRAAVETFSRYEVVLRRTARRYSICEDDADDAMQRALEILLVKAPSEDPRELVRWTQTVVKHEALAVRSERERILSRPAAATAPDGGEDWVASIPTQSDGPPERVERREAVARGREALRALKPQELRALSLLAEGYSYAEIGEITGFSPTKINRCLAEGRERFRRIVSRSEDGQRCADLRPLLSAFCDGEAGPEDAATVREHLRACAGCRSAMRSYRAAPRAVAALTPALPIGRSLLDRLHEAIAGLAARLGGAGDSATSQVAAAGGARGAGMAALGKMLAICVGAASGVGACVAAGVVPAPFAVEHGHAERPAAETRSDRTLEASASADAGVDYEPAPNAPSSEAPATHRPAERSSTPSPSQEPSSGAVEYEPTEPAPAPAPAAPAPAPSTSTSTSSAGSPAGEFGP